MPVFNVKSRGDFAKRLDARKALWTNKKIVIRLVVPPELSWWYFLEDGTVPRTIKANEASMLVFPDGKGGKVFEMSVESPGIAPRHIVARVLAIIDDKLAELAIKAFQDGAGDDPQILRSAVIASVEYAKEKIVISLAEQAPGTRPDDPRFPKQGGKLHGRTAASVFEEEAQIVDKGE